VRADTDKPRMGGVSADPDMSVRGRSAARSAPTAPSQVTRCDSQCAIRCWRRLVGRVEAATRKAGDPVLARLVSRLCFRFLRGLQVGGVVALGATGIYPTPPIRYQSVTTETGGTQGPGDDERMFALLRLWPTCRSRNSSRTGAGRSPCFRRLPRSPRTPALPAQQPHRGTRRRARGSPPHQCDRARAVPPAPLFTSGRTPFNRPNNAAADRFFLSATTPGLSCAASDPIWRTGQRVSTG
jgi:hypothetical protein